MIVFLDTETTGLDPENCRMLELAIVITDDNLNILNQFNAVISQSEKDLNQMNDWCKRQHGASGLIEEVLSSVWPLETVEIDAINFLRDNGVELNTQPISGNTVHFDRAFLKVHMPRLEKYFRYRNIDISTLQELGRRWGFEDAKDKTKGNHRALGDCLNCIEQAKNYKRLFDFYNQTETASQVMKERREVLDKLGKEE